jgi:hypothetical protein
MTETELRKLDLEIANLIAETAKLTAETSKYNKELRWYEVTLIIAGTLAVVAIVKLFI